MMMPYPEHASVASKGFAIFVVDVAAMARELFGAAGAEIVRGEPLPEHDHRFVMIGPTGARTTFSAGATAEYVANHIRECGR